jgi:hypothetical protein
MVKEIIDPHSKYIKRIFSRENCIFKNNLILKKISFTGLSDKNTILIDDNEQIVSINAMNSILIKKLDT